MVSTMSGPIPPHPYYDKSGSNHIDRPVPRVRPEAEIYAKQASGSIQNLFNELNIQGTGYGGAPSMRKYKPEPKNHVEENVRRMRRIQRETRRRQEESSRPMKAMWKSSKFENVPSKVKEKLQKEPPNRPQSAHSYLRAHSRTGFTPSPQSRPATAEPPVEKLSIPRASSAREINLKRSNIDFIKVNGVAARHSGMKRSPSLTALDELKKKQEEDQKSYRKGCVPAYLRQRQKDWQAEEERRIASQADPDMPAGHRVMDKKEKEETLKKLTETQTELTRKMASLPIRTDTLRMRKVKEELEAKMAEVEEAIRIFSRPKVFVKLDS